MYMTEDYRRYFNLSFPAPKRRLSEAVEIDELERLDAQIEKLKKEIRQYSNTGFFVDTQKDAIKKLRNDPEHSAFMAQFEELEQEVRKLIDSCKAETRWSTRYAPDYEIDQKAYEKIKDKVEPLEARLKQLRATYKQLVRKAKGEVQAERDAARKPREAAHKASTDARAKLFNQLIAEEKANIDEAVKLLNTRDAEHLSWDPAACTFRNRTLTVPVFTGWHEDRDFGADFDDIFNDFGISTDDGEGYSSDDYDFDEDAYIERMGDKFLEDAQIWGEAVAEDLSLTKTEGGYAILPEAGWVLDADFTIQLKDTPEVTELETRGVSHRDWWQTGESEGMHIDYIRFSDVFYRVVGYLTKKF